MSERMKKTYYPIKASLRPGSGQNLGGHQDFVEQWKRQGVVVDVEARKREKQDR